MSRLILHVDMDAFFAAVEIKANPSLAGKPLAVAGPGERTIITTSSYEARKYGVKTGMALGQARVLCPQMIIVRADHRKYSMASKEVMEILGRFSPELSQFSVDEAFLDVTGLAENLTEAGEMADRVRATVKKDAGLTCSVGVAHSRILAKLASGMKKPNGTTVIHAEKAAEILTETPVNKLCGIGPKTTEALNRMGIRNCGQLAGTPEELLRRRFGIYGRTLVSMARGEDGPGSLDHAKGDEPVKSVGHSATFPRDMSDLDEIRRAVLTISEMVGRRARRHGISGVRVTLTVRYNDFTTFTRQLTCPVPVKNTADIYQVCLQILNKLELKRPVRLLGVSLGNLTTGPVDAPLLPQDQRGEQLQEAMDRVNDRYGAFSVGSGDNLKDIRGNKIISPAWRVSGVRKTTED
jgi:DNA polymerase-4